MSLLPFFPVTDSSRTQRTHPPASRVAGEVALCECTVGSERFAIAARAVQEVLVRTPLKRVPLAPSAVAGVLSYRGEVLVAVGLRALLGLLPFAGTSALLVLKGQADGWGKIEPYALAVDGVTRVIEAVDPSEEMSPACCTAFCAAMHRVEGRLLCELDPRLLAPGRLAPAHAATLPRERAGAKGAGTGVVGTGQTATGQGATGLGATGLGTTSQGATGQAATGQYGLQEGSRDIG